MARMGRQAHATKKSGKQLDDEIAAALVRYRSTSSHLTKPAPSGTPLRKALSEGNQTLLSIVKLASPLYKLPAASVMVELSDHVDREASDLYPLQRYNDALVWLYGTMAVKTVTLPGLGGLSTGVPLGASYVSVRKRPIGGSSGSTVYLPPLESSTIEVAVDAVIETGHITPEVVDMIGSALQGRGGLLRKAYIAAVARIANRRMQNEARAPRL